MADDVHVTGLSELNKFLEDLPVKIERNILRSALRQGANVILAAARSGVPVGPTSSENAKIYGGYAGALRDSLHVSTRSNGGTVIGRVVAGGKMKSGADVYYAHFIEYGTRPHRIENLNKKAIAFGGQIFKSVEHPGAPPHPFLRPALDARAQDAVVAFGNQIKARLTKEGIDVADIMVEGDE
jgi:HK97 gp10 family phage protein